MVRINEATSIAVVLLLIYQIDSNAHFAVFRQFHFLFLLFFCLILHFIVQKILQSFLSLIVVNSISSKRRIFLACCCCKRPLLQEKIQRGGHGLLPVFFSHIMIVEDELEWAPFFFLNDIGVKGGTAEQLKLRRIFFFLKCTWL